MNSKTDTIPSIPKPSSFERLVRKFIPSTSMLSYNPLFKVIVGIPSWLYSLTSPAFRGLPPNYMRIRIGVRNDIFFNHAPFLTTAPPFWFAAALKGWINLQSNIIDIGVGCGRSAVFLRNWSFYGERYTGQFLGIDIDDEMLDWCRANYPAKNFRFERSDHSSTSYKGSGTGSSSIRLPVADSTQDLVYSKSLFSHLLEPELVNYIRESARVLKPGGIMSMTYFSLTTHPPSLGGRHTFQHQMGIARIESLKQPTAAVAYYDEDLKRLVLEAGFSKVEFTRDTTVRQQMMIASR
jgi:ubiquinone/menaquinone biosynthesis C-methylase UbiE